MPTYEYECEKCGKHFDKFQKMSDEPVGNCPECGGNAQRLIGTGGGIIFKGSGFYQTDYKNPSSRVRDSALSEARDKNKIDKKACDKPKSDGCKSCSLNKE